MQNETKVCKHCQTEIPKKAKVCPNCRKKQGGLIKWIIIGVIAIAIIGSLAGGSDDEKGTDSNPKKTGQTQNSENDSNKQENVDNEFVVGDVVETSSLKISYLSAGQYTSDNEFLQPKDGYVYYRVEFEFENIGNSDELASSWDFKCYADGYSVDEAYVGEDTLSATISSGKKAKGAIYYEVPIDAQEIKLEYEINYFTEDKVVFVIK